MKTLLLILITASCYGQGVNKNYWKKQAVVFASCFASGWFRAENDFLYFEYSKYQDRWPNANPQWANPRLSANNKYKPGTKEPAFVILGLKSTHALAFATDKQHLNTFTSNALWANAVGFSCTLYPFEKGKRKGLFWKGAAQAVLVHSATALGRAACFKFYKYPL
jgi:hypothetical protein